MTKTRAPQLTGPSTGAVRIARALASPAGVLITVPLLVIAVGIGIMLLGRNATRTSTGSMARRQLAEQAKSVQADVAFALDQADPLMKLVSVLAVRDRPLEDTLVRLHDLMAARPGIAFLSISFPDGTFRGAQYDANRHIEVQESTVEPFQAQWFTVIDGRLQPLRTEHTQYDPRKRGFYQLAVAKRARAWTDPYTFFRSHETGITCTEPLFDAMGNLQAVLTVDFDVGALSSFVARPALDQARSLVFTKDGVILAYPAADKLGLPASDKLLRVDDLHDPAIDSMFAALTKQSADSLRFLDLDASDGEYLASVAPIGGKRAGIDVPLDWYVATVVPAKTLLGPTRKLERASIVASAGAMGIAVGLALVLAWNLVRMRRQVTTAREEARSAEARARELGSYRLVAKLGSGGMGEVWRAEHRLLARHAAIKLIRPEVENSDGIAEIRERFRREAQTLASMKSRNTIALFDYGVTNDGTFYYVMELLDGLDLESLIVRYGAQPAARVIQMLIQACSSLAEAHEHGLYHRDIKPPNLYLCRAADEVDIIKLLDFGIVQTVNEPPARVVTLTKSPILETPKLTQLGAMLGTPGFMAPEQILGMQIDGRADIYALGCVAWWLLTGNEVFSRDGGEAKVLQRHLYEELPPLREKVRGFMPPELEEIVKACLAKEADDRPRDARDLAKHLRAIQISEDYVWSPERSNAWWRNYSPPQPVPNLPSGEVQVIMPGRTAANRPMVATGADAIAQTMAGPAANTKLDVGDK
ncbi:MAG TPA: serine/threonine protein kinase [Kofleriaceae bacterium]|nr:serine/threonine protein kinase [Kofleriaceae bacterium]